MIDAMFTYMGMLAIIGCISVCTSRIPKHVWFALSVSVWATYMLQYRTLGGYNLTLKHPSLTSQFDLCEIRVSQ